MLYFLFNFMCMCGLSTSMTMQHVLSFSDICGSQRGAFNFLEMELQMAVNCFEGAGNQTVDLRQNSWYLCLLEPSLQSYA